MSKRLDFYLLLIVGSRSSESLRTFVCGLLNMVKLLLLAANLLVAQGALIQVHEALDASEARRKGMGSSS